MKIAVLHRKKKDGFRGADSHEKTLSEKTNLEIFQDILNRRYYKKKRELNGTGGARWVQLLSFVLGGIFAIISIFDIFNLPHFSCMFNTEHAHKYVRCISILCPHVPFDL